MPTSFRSSARRAALILAALSLPVLAPAAQAGTAAAADRPASWANTISLPGEHLHPESLSIAPGGVAYVGSMTGGVLRVRLTHAHIEQFIAPGAYGSGALFGVFADMRHGLLWTCTNSFPAPLTHVAGADAGHWVKAFDLKTGKGRISLPMPGDSPVCNDFALGPDGAIYITDTGQPRVLRWKPGATALEVWAEDPIFNAPAPKKSGLDGLAFTADGTLYVNNVRDGSLYRVARLPDGRAGPITRLTTDRPLQSPDGMRALGKRLLVAEGVGRIARLTIDGDTVHVETLDEGIKEPTGVDSEGKTAWYVQGQLSGLFNPDKAPPVQLPFRLTPITLGATFDK
jgi:sugar lactone lactonase YvrE